MVDQYSLFYRILEGDLNPLLPDNTRERNFDQFYKDDSPRELKDNPYENLIFVNTCMAESRIAKYYISVIQNECNRLVKAFDSELASSDDLVKFSGYITMQYDRLLLLMKKAHVKHQTFGKEFEERYVNMMVLDNKFKKKAAIRDILFYFHEFLIELSLHVQKVYVTYITSKRYENKNEIYRNYYLEPPPLLSTKYDAIKTYTSATKELINKNKYNLKVTSKLLNDIVKVFNNFSDFKGSIYRDAEFHQSFTENINALENLIFVKTHSLNAPVIDYVVFTSDFFSNSIIGDFKKDTKNKLSEIHNHIDRIDFIDSLLRKNENYLVHQKVPDEIKINSLPRLAENWLNLTRDFYIKDNEAQKQHKDFALSLGINEIQQKMKTNFHPSIVNFLQKANPELKFRSDWSCLGFYDNLYSYYKELIPELQLHFMSILPADRPLFIDTYVRYILNVSGRYRGGLEENAQFFLEERNITLEDVFEIQIRIPGISQNEFPGFFRHTYDTLSKKFDYNITDLHCSFFYLISDFYIKKLLDFITNLPVPGSNQVVMDNNQVIKTEPVPQLKKEKSIPIAYTYKKFNTDPSKISDLLSSLKKNKFVSEETDIKDFKKIFNNKSPEKPIQWIGGIETLSCFIKLIHNDFELISKNDKIIWKITDQIFVDENNNPFGRKRLRWQQPPKKADLVEKAVEHLK